MSASSSAQTQNSTDVLRTIATPLSWAQAAAANQLRIISEDGTFAKRYMVRKVDNREDTTRDTIESRDGVVARLVLRDGRPITAAEDAAERQRLEDMLASPSDVARRRKRNASSRSYASDLVRQMPQAMIYSYAPGQPQPAGSRSPQVVLDFRPDPNFHPPGMVAGLLTGLEGRLWIDAQTHTLTRGEGRLVQSVDFGWGVLARLYAGGTIEFEQEPVGEGHWMYSRVVEHLRIREMLVKSVSQNSVLSAYDFQSMPVRLSYQEAIHTLLETPLPTQSEKPTR